MKYVFVILFSLIGLTAFSQTQSVKDSLFINRLPPADSAFITLNQLNAVVAKVRKEMNMESGEPAIQALQLLYNEALAELRRKRTQQLKSKN